MGRLPTYFLSHGGGPWPWLTGDFRAMFDQLEASLVRLRSDLGGARAILVVSGHWECPEFTVSSGAHPGMVYDYHGFPDYTYQIRYSAPGSPELAANVRALLGAKDIAAAADADRGFDHGTFSLMQVLYPQADMPVVQLSLKAGYDPAEHVKVGRALAPLRDEGIAIIGSGLSYHNLRALRSPAGAAPSREFDSWLQDTLLRVNPTERVGRLEAWTKAPSARAVHPHEDHLLPLMVAVGAAEQEPGSCVYHEDAFMGVVAVSSFRFGPVAAVS